MQRGHGPPSGSRRRDRARVWRLRTRKHAREGLHDPNSTFGPATTCGSQSSGSPAWLPFSKRCTARGTQAEHMDSISADINRARRLLLAAYNQLQIQPRELNLVRAVI